MGTLDDLVLQNDGLLTVYSFLISEVLLRPLSSGLFITAPGLHVAGNSKIRMEMILMLWFCFMNLPCSHVKQSC